MDAPVKFRKADPGELSLGASLIRLHEVAWGGKWEDVFFKHTVQHDTSRSTSSSEHIALRWEKDLTSPIPGFDASAILVRDVYRKLLREIIYKAWFWKRPGRSVPRCIGNSTNRNLFLQLQLEDLDGHIGAVVNSCPDTGKSSFLIYVLALRLLARKPTLFLSNTSTIYLVNEAGVYEARTDKADHFLLNNTPLGAWILVDSDFGDHYCLSHPGFAPNWFHGFILRSSNPSYSSWCWTEYRNFTVPTYWMPSWSTEELIAGRDFQVFEDISKPSQADIVSFSRQFGTSPRHVYGYASRPRTYEAILRDKIGALTLKNYDDLVLFCIGMSRDYELSYLLFVAIPVSESMEEEVFLRDASDHVASLLVDHFLKERPDAVLRMYEAFLGHPPGTSNGYLLKRLCLERFARGGEWDICALRRHGKWSRNRPDRWIHDRIPARLILRLGHCGHIAAITETPLGEDEKCDRLPWFHYSEHYKLKLKSGLYIPQPQLQTKSDTSFDAFIYDAKELKAIVFHWRLSMREVNKIRNRTFEWLRQRGVQNIDLIIVTSYVPMSLPIFEPQLPKDYMAGTGGVYHIVLSNLEKYTWGTPL